MRKKFMGILITLCMIMSLLPMTVKAASEKGMDGWYYLRCMYNYLNIDDKGGAELRKLSQNEAFYVQTVGEGRITLKMKDGRYLGIEGERKDGVRVKAVNKPYTWRIYEDKKEADVFSLRSPEAVKMIVNASGEKKTDGTPIILWTHLSSGGHLAAPNHARFRFIPADTDTPDSTGESWLLYEENGLYGYKNRSGKVMIKAQFDDAEKFSKGIAKVYNKKKDACAYIDTAGKLLTPFKYYDAGSDWIVSDGLILVGIHGADVAKALIYGDGVDYLGGKGNIEGAVMKSGKVLKYEPKWGYINTKGKEVIPPKFDFANRFQEGKAAVFKKGGKSEGVDIHNVGWIDPSGKLVIPYKSYDAGNYVETVHDFKDGLVRYFVKRGDSHTVAPAAGIMDKTGKVIISHNLDKWFPSTSGSFILDWKDGVIVAGPYTRVNEKGEVSKNGKYTWNFPAIYDYSGKLIKKLDGYVEAVPLGGGYTLALHQSFEDVRKGNTLSGYWSLFDRTGKMVIEKAEENNFYLMNSEMGIDNSFVYFGDTRYQIP